jgi:hypothetical protein
MAWINRITKVTVGLNSLTVNYEYTDGETILKKVRSVNLASEIDSCIANDLKRLECLDIERDKLITKSSYVINEQSNIKSEIK